MNRLDRYSLPIVWFVLCAATLASVGSNDRLAGIDSAKAAGIVVLAIAFGKVHLVMSHFMELKDAPAIWRGIFAAWTLLTLLVLAGLYAWRG
ncbi:MAG: cytochrome C oxidase subunit IV family protein [Pseudomonadota bacterium]